MPLWERTESAFSLKKFFLHSLTFKCKNRFWSNHLYNKGRSFVNFVEERDSVIVSSILVIWLEKTTTVFKNNVFLFF